MHDAEIHPIPFREPSSPRRPPWLRRVAGLALLVLLGISAALAWIVFTAEQVSLQIEPTPDRITLRGTWLTPKIGESYLLQRGEYILKADKAGYHTLEEIIQVTGEGDRPLRFTMRKLPGRLSIAAHGLDKPEQPVTGARVFLDDRFIGENPVTLAEVEPGSYTLTVVAPEYRRFEETLDVEGMGIARTLDVTLVPAWAHVTIDSVPRGAGIHVDGTPAGSTPSTLRLTEGEHRLRIALESFKPWATTLTVKGNEPQTLDAVRLEPADGILAVRTDPEGATVILGTTYAGRTPLEISLPPGKSHVLKISKPGYQEKAHEVAISPGKRQEVLLTLVPQKGRIYLDVAPEDATLFINGKAQGIPPKHLDLVAVPHDIEFRKQGYESFSTRMTPRSGFPQQLKVVMEKSASKERGQAETIEPLEGCALRLIRPGTYTMGSSRRQQGRRSNETLRTIALKRPFYMGTMEVTNKQFRAFLAGHDSGMFKGQALSRDDQPVVRVTWEQAALFCNWLSARESLPPVYVKKADRLEAAEVLGTGYRLPTEAEWEYCARFHAKGDLGKYPWGESFPPEEKTVNIADASAKNLLSLYLEAYNDNYPVSAPSGSFKPNGLGIHDLAGNVAELCHDYYSIYSYKPEEAYQDPLGPREGKHRVVRGSSWKHAGISALRVAYRDYSSGSREDLGFRICRYAEEEATK